MEQALRNDKQGQTHKHDLSNGDQTQIHQINNMPEVRYVSTKVHEVEEANVVINTQSKTLKSQRLLHQQPAYETHQLIINKQVISKSSQVWDCGSALYDSFELNSFNRQLDSAIKASFRANSMPHLHERRWPNNTPVPETEPVTTTLIKHQTLPRKGSKLSKSFKKVMKSIFRSSSTSVNNGLKSPFTKAMSSEKLKDSFYVYNGSKSGRVLSTIPEMQECDEQGYKRPLETTPVVRRAASERFSVAIVSVSCKSRY